jgi:DNA invertase Pin-like site-specific DNA recombinase
MKKAGIYCRVSTTNEEDKLSCEAQEAACRQYLEELGNYEVVEVISDVEAVENPDRAGISKLIAMAGKRQLVAICMDRKERLGPDADVVAILIGDLEELGAEVLFVNDDAAGDGGDGGSDDSNGNNTSST